MNLDFQIFGFLNGWTNHSRILDDIFIFLGVYLVYIFSAVAILYWFINKDKFRARKAVVIAFISFVLARGVITELIRLFYHRQRPFDLGLIAHPIVNMTGVVNEASFPSGHATAMFSIAAAIYFYNKRLGGWLLLMSVLTAICRVVIGVHYPADVTGGAIIGILTAWIVDRLWADKIDGITQKLSGWSDKYLSFTKRG